MADSDAPADQAVKLKVRDAVLKEAAPWYEGAQSRAQAESAIQAHLPDIIQTANQTLRANGFAPNAQAKLCDTYFPTRTYGSMALPAGTYRALQITIGSGEGKNWWCVVFPALCLPAAEPTDEALLPLTPAQRELVEHPEEHRVAFKVVEWLEYLRHLCGPQ